MTDCELLEMAAKGVGGIYTDGLGECWNVERGAKWAPLTDDGDALRLAVKLRIVHSNPPSLRGYIRASGESPTRKVCNDVPIHGDACAATRRAIVRVAAAIGQEKGGA